MDGIGSKFDVTTKDKGVATFSIRKNDASSTENTYIAVVDIDGDLHIKSLQMSGVEYVTETVKHSMHRIVSRDMARSNMCKMSWSPKGLFLAVPSNEVIAFFYSDDEGASWKEGMLVTPESNIKFLHAVFSPDGKHLATSELGGKVTIWQVDQAKLNECTTVSTFQCSDAALVDIAWGPSVGDNYLVVLSATSWAKIDQPIPAKAHPEVAAAAAPSAAATTATVTTAVAMDAEAAAAQAPSSDESTNGASDGMDVINPENNPRRLQKKSGGAAADDDDDDDVFEDDTINVTAIKNATVGNGVVDLDKNDDEDDEDIADEWNAANAVNIPRLEEIEEVVRKAKEQLVPIHPPIHPSSTVLDDKGRRYLVWNSVGNITARHDPKDVTDNRYEIKFSNAMGKNRQEAFNDNYVFTMASLAFEGAIFASDPEVPDEDQITPPHGSTICYRAFSSFLDGANETFTKQLEAGEAALAVAVGSGWSAVATSKGFLRIFSSTGYQLSVTWLKGPVVALCGYGAQLAVVVNAAQPVEGTCRLSVELYSMNPFAPGCSRSILPSDMMLPLTSRATLEWIGFDVDSKFLSIIDSAGMCSMLMRPFGWQWMPMLDISRAKKSPQHVYWPVMVKSAKLVYVLLNGENKPAVYPVPVTAAKGLRIPIIEGEKKGSKEVKEKQEEEYEKWHLFAFDTAKAAHLEGLKTEETVFGLLPIENHLTPEQLQTRFELQENEADRTVVWMMQKACARNRTSEALDLAHKLRTMKGFEGAIMVANHLGRVVVAKKLQEIQDSRFPSTIEPEASNMGYYQASDQFHEQQNHSYDETLVRGVAADDDYVGGQNENMGGNPQEVQSIRTKSKSVTPSVPAPEQRVAVNPFARGTASPVGKRKVAYEAKDLKSLKSSPSPSKKPMLSVRVPELLP